MLSRIALLSILCGLAFAASVSPPPAIEWGADVDAAVARAEESGALVLVQFTRDDLPAAAAMRATFDDPDVIAASSGFRHVRIDTGARPELFAALTGERGALATCVLDGNGATLAVQCGFAGPRAHIAFLARVEREVEAWRAATEAVAATPGDAAARCTLAEAYVRAGHERAAEATFARALELARAPNGSPTVIVRSLECLARLAVERGASADARRQLTELRAADPQRELEHCDHTLLTEALAFFVERELTEATARLEARRATGDEADRALLALGEVAHAAGTEDAALAALQTLVQAHPDSPWRRRAEQCIAHIENPQWAHTH